MWSHISLNHISWNITGRGPWAFCIMLSLTIPRWCHAPPRQIRAKNLTPKTLDLNVKTWYLHETSNMKLYRWKWKINSLFKRISELKYWFNSDKRLNFSLDLAPYIPTFKITPMIPHYLTWSSNYVVCFIWSASSLFRMMHDMLTHSGNWCWQSAVLPGWQSNLAFVPKMTHRGPTAWLSVPTSELALLAKYGTRTQHWTGHNIRTKTTKLYK